MNNEMAMNVRDIPTAIGVFQLAATTAGVCALRFPGQLIDAKSHAPSDTSAFEGDTSQILDIAQTWLVAYVSGQQLPPLPPIDTGWCTDFGKAVYAELIQVPPGSTTTYGELATRLSRPGAARAIGGCMARNRVPVIIPCHRVLQHSGAMGGWSGPRGMKEWLLAHERLAFAPGTPT